MSARPTVSVYSAEGESATSSKSLPMPDVFLAPIRPDVVHFVHSNMAKNKRQAYCVNEYCLTAASRQPTLGS